MAKDHTTLLRQAQRQPNMTVRKLPGGHIEVTGPKGKYTSASTPGRGRATANLRAGLKRIGLVEGDVVTKKDLSAPDHRAKLTLTLEALQSHQGEALRAGEVWQLMGAEDSGMTAQHVAANLSVLHSKHPEVKRPDRGLYCYQPEASGARDGTAPDRQPERPSAEEPPRPQPGMDVTADDAALEVTTLKPERTRRVTVVPTAVPGDVPTMLETVTVHNTGGLISRDEHGELWISYPIKVTIPQISRA